MAASTAAAAATAATAATESTSATRFAWFGLVDLKGATVLVLTVQSGHGRLGLRSGAHLDESETFALSGRTVFDDLRTLDRAVWGE